ncbi:phosphatidylethanolamine-binding protein 4-like [Lytechinus variegatus]|uniref:phosphatidylethanolamine-binding protein 4-like n=1 Tax=Lytechinus variegatus TaxID=7654 RepID=UPI001BB22C2E|nr:phosphatidylethanolamine-binding protein 4-like [Lytechinus variegatus]
MSNRQNFGRFPLLFLLLAVDISLGDLNNFCDEEISQRLDVKFSGEVLISYGGALPITLFQEPGTGKESPLVRYERASGEDFYTLLMIDPDAPQSPWLHWLVMNIKGDDLNDFGDLKGDTVTEYAPPTPPAGSGYHRYFFYLYYQPHGAVSSDLGFAVPSRARFDVGALLEEYGLECEAIHYFKTRSE